MAYEGKSTGGFKSSKPRTSDAGPSKPKQTTEPRAAPSFVSTLQDEGADFPRGGGSALTPLELKQTRAEGRREAEQDVAREQGKGVKRRRQISEREAKRLKKNEVDEQRKERDKDTIRVEELSYKKLIPGTHLLTRVHTVLPLHLILSLPNNLLAHVPITEISNTLTKLLSAEEDESDDEDEDDKMSQASSSHSDTSGKDSAPDLAQLFVPGQYVPAKVINLFPTASQSFISQYPVTETTRLAARVEMSLIPAKVNSEFAKADLKKGLNLFGEVLSEEDKGWRVGLGLNKDEGMGDIEGWLPKTEAAHSANAIVPGQLLAVSMADVTAGGRVVQLSIEAERLVGSLLGEVSNVGSILPGHLVSALVTAVVPSGLNVKVCGFFEGTVDLAHVDAGGEDLEEKYKIGKKIKARVIYDTLSSTPRHFSLSLLPHVLSLISPVMPGTATPLEQAVPIGKLISSVKITRVLPEWGVMCRTDDGLEGFVHISHISDERIPALSGSTGQFRVDTLHRARVIGHSPMDGILLLSFEQKVLDQVFMQVDELTVGQALKGTIHKLSDKALFVNISGSVDGVVWPLHYADIRLKHPEKRFKVGGTVKARVFALEPARSRVILTLKKTLVDSDLEIPTGFADVKPGMITPAVVSKILDKGCIVDLFGGLRAFIPQSEASQNFIAKLSDIFFVGKPVNVRITEVDSVNGKLVASVRQALPTALTGDSLKIGSEVSGLVSQIHAEQVVVSLIPTQLTALLSLSNLSNHRQEEIEQVRSSLKVGARLDDLVVVSRNEKSGLLIVANKRTGSAFPSVKEKKSTEGTASGISKVVREIDGITPGQTISGQVVSYTPQGTMVQLTPSVRGRVHPTDVSDDFEVVAKGQGPLTEDEIAKCYVLKVNPSTKIIDLSTRQSRLEPDSGVDIIDKEIQGVQDLKEGMQIRGLVKNVSDHGVFVALGRNTTARVMIKELFDEYVKDWQSRFEVNQLVSGKIVSIDQKKRTVEMTLKKNPDSKASKRVALLGLSDFTEGQKVVAAVKKVEAYGMFLKIEGSDISGLCHKSELSDNKKQDVSKALKGFRAGDQVKAVIISIDREKRQVNFSIKASLFSDKVVNEDDDDEMAEDVDDAEAGSDDEDDEDEDADEDQLEGLDIEGEDEDEEDVEEEDEDEDEAAEDDSDDEEVKIDLASKPAATTKKAKSTKSTEPTASLNVAGGFDWTGQDAASDADSDESSDEDDEAADATAAKARSKSKGKQRASDDLTSTAPDAKPESDTDFERALLASPNSSFLWIQYMSFQLQLHEIAKARKIGRTALEKINFREEEEKLNVWMALVNLEIGFGDDETREKVFKEAGEYNDKRTVFIRYAESLLAAGKENLAEDVYKKLVKRFSANPDSWSRAAEYYFKKGDTDEARDLLPRSLKSLDKSKHVEMIEKMAVLEFRHGEAERGKTLFEGLVDRYPKRLDLWNVYIDQMAKVQDIQGIRGLFSRALEQKLTAKKAKFLFKKWLHLEMRLGTTASATEVKGKASAWVQANTAPKADDADSDEE